MCMMGSPTIQQAPAPPPLPAPVPVPASNASNSPEAMRAAAEEVQQQRRRAGRASTMLTSGSGLAETVMGTPPRAGGTLLG